MKPARPKHAEPLRGFSSCGLFFVCLSMFRERESTTLLEKRGVAPALFLRLFPEQSLAHILYAWSATQLIEGSLASLLLRDSGSVCGSCLICDQQGSILFNQILIHGPIQSPERYKFVLQILCWDSIITDQYAQTGVLRTDCVV